MGGTCIGILRVETGEYMFGIVPVELYKPRCLRKRVPGKVVHIVRDAFSTMNPGKKEKIFVCRGTCLTVL